LHRGIGVDGNHRMGHAFFNEHRAPLVSKV
jgi:hypothetical protein